MGFVFGLLTAVCVIGLLNVFGYVTFDFGEDSTDELEHYHEWTVRGAHQLFNVRCYPGTGLPAQRTEDGEPITEVLYRCGCGDVTTETLAGHWTFEQLAGVAGSGKTVEAEEDAEEEPTMEFCGFESLHEAHEWRGDPSEAHPTGVSKQCPGSLVTLAPVSTGDTGDTISQAVAESK
jgi:hypothetical protein